MVCSSAQVNDDATSMAVYCHTMPGVLAAPRRASLRRADLETVELDQVSGVVRPRSDPDPGRERTGPVGGAEAHQRSTRPRARASSRYR